MIKIRATTIRHGTAPCRGTGEAVALEVFFLILGAAIRSGERLQDPAPAEASRFYITS